MPADRPTVLIVDDQPNFLDLLVAYLEDDYSIRTATGGTEALDLIDDSIDLLSLDRRMPDLAGDEVVKRVRSRGWSGKILMVSAVEPREPALAGWDDYLEKPLLKAEYRSAIDRLLDSS